MKTLRTFPGQRVALGHQGENLALTVIFSIGAWADAYGPGTVHLAHMRNGDSEAYPVAVTQVGTEVSWEVSDADTAVDGYGKYELRYIVGETVVKSSVGETYVRKALQYGAEPPEPVQSWLDHVAEKEHELLEAAVEAKEHSENASRSAESAASSAKDAADSAAEAKAAADAAQEAVKNADFVKTVNGNAPDENGDVHVDAGGVKTVNGQAPDENGNVQIVVSGGSGIDVTAKPGQMIRVKEVDENGKPLAWEPVPWGWVEGEVYADGEYVSRFIPYFGVFVIDFSDDVETIPESVSVVFDGVKYSNLNSAEVPGMGTAFGNLYYMNAVIGTSYENTGEPFLVGVSNIGVTLFLADTESTRHTVTITFNKTIHPIPGKLLPKGVAYVEHGAKVGQTVRISAVDVNGVPTAWESVDFPSGGSGGNVDFRVGETLKLENGVLSVNTTNDMEQDNTLPITSAGVFATVGNIEALLKTI